MLTTDEFSNCVTKDSLCFWKRQIVICEICKSFCKVQHLTHHHRVITHHRGHRVGIIVNTAAISFLFFIHHIFEKPINDLELTFLLVAVR